MKIHSDESGFTLIELLIAALFVSLLVLGCTHNHHEKSKEAEVKSNIHAIHAALERYAVESGGVYPLILYGGDMKDSFTTPDSPDYEDSEGKIQKGVSEYEGDVDVLITYGYLSQYPRNPFSRKRDIEKYGYLISQPGRYNLPHMDYRVNIWAGNCQTENSYPDRAQQYRDRRVGGEKGNIMWDVSEGQRHAPFPIFIERKNREFKKGNHYNYDNPKYAEHVELAKPLHDRLFSYLPGNFYYYAVFGVPGGYSGFINGDLNSPYITEAVGYNLAGYGEPTNPGQDVYNIFGDFPDGSLLMPNDPNTDLEEMSSQIPDPQDYYSGPDGRKDGVIIVIQSGISIDRSRITRLGDGDYVLRGISSNYQEELEETGK
jgi:type II secretory pathway pseudopilin PulG